MPNSSLIHDLSRYFHPEDYEITVTDGENGASVRIVNLVDGKDFFAPVLESDTAESIYDIYQEHAGILTTKDEEAALSEEAEAWRVLFQEGGDDK